MDSETVSGLHVRIPGSQGIARVKSEKETWESWQGSEFAKL